MPTNIALCVYHYKHHQLLDDRPYCKGCYQLVLFMSEHVIALAIVTMVKKSKAEKISVAFHYYYTVGRKHVTLAYITL